MKHHLPHLFFAATAAFFAATIPSVVAQAQHTVWFDEPTSFAGHAIWTQEIPEGAPTDYKPVNAGEQNWNRDREWEQRSLPLGNGSLGANVMGSIATERYTLNEKTLWRGGPGTADGPAHYWNQNKESAHLLPEIRQAFLDGDLNKAAELTMRNFNSTVPYEAKGERSFRFGSFTTLGELCIETGLNDKDARHYRRALSIDSALATVSFSANGVDYRRETFISYPHNVMAIRFSASEKGKQQLRLAYTPNPCAEGKVTATANGNLLYEGRLDNNGMQFVVRLQAQAKGGTLAAEGDTLVVRNADEVVILLTADTDYKPNYDPDLNDAKAYVGVNPLATTEGWMRKASKTSWNKLLQTHLRDYTALFGRVKFHAWKPIARAPRTKASKRSTTNSAATCSSPLRVRAICPPTSKVSGTTTSTDPGAWTTTTISTCK